MALPSIPTAPQLPAFLSDFADIGLDIGANVTGGFKSGGHPSIGIKQAKFRLREGANEELVQSFTLNVIIVNANKHLSKVYYAGAYSGEEGKQPDCFSDNGTSPSTRAGNPQCGNCATCPHNAWGSKISPTGAKIKACSDYKKLAVILADDPERNVYELRIPGASLKDLNTVMAKLIANRVPVPAVVFQLSFDADAEYPKLQFKPLGYVDEAQAASIKRWVGSAEAKEAVGEDDIAATVSAIPAPQTPALPKADPLFEPSAVEEKKRGRPAKATKPEVVEEQLNLDLPGASSPAAATTIKPTKTDEALDALLAGIL